MKIAFLIQLNSGLEGKLANKFHRLPKIVIYSIENKELQLFEKTKNHFSSRISTLKLLNENQVNVLICKKLSRRFIERLAKNDIEVKITKHQIVKDALKAYFLGEIL